MIIQILKFRLINEKENVTISNIIKNNINNIVPI